MRLRRARSDGVDCQFVWSLRNADDVRELSGDTATIPYESHAEWYAGAYGWIWIVCLDDISVGYVREDPITYDGVYGGSSSVSMALVAEARGKGLGLAALRLLTERTQSHTLRAKIDARNTASIRTFTRAGFVVNTYSVHNQSGRRFVTMEWERA